MAYLPRITQVCPSLPFYTPLVFFLPLPATRHISKLVLWEFSQTTYVPDCCSSSHVLSFLGWFFSRCLLSLAALMSLKRKYLNEPENGEAEGKQGSSDAVSPYSPASFNQFIPKTFSNREMKLSPTLPESENYIAISNLLLYLPCGLV